jgi:hypothetical protein
MKIASAALQPLSFAADQTKRTKACWQWHAGFTKLPESRAQSPDKRVLPFDGDTVLVNLQNDRLRFIFLGRISCRYENETWPLRGDGSQGGSFDSLQQRATAAARCGPCANK